jgi:hypothetical protein
VRTLEDRALLLLIVAVSLAFAWILWPFFSAVLWATVLAIVFAPLYRRILRSIGQHPNIAALATLLIIVALVIVPLSLTATSLVQEATSLYDRIQSGELNLGTVFQQLRGLAVQTRHRWLRILAPILGLLLAMAAHMINNALPLFATLAKIGAGKLPSESEQIPDVGFFQGFVTGSLIQLTIFVPFLLIMALAVWRSGVWERRVIREELADEIGQTVTLDEYRAIVDDHMLRTRRMDRTHPRTSAALVNAQNELAFRKRRVKEEGGDPELDELVAGWREDIRRLRSGIVSLAPRQ